MIIRSLVASLLIRKMLLVAIAMVLSTNIVLAQNAPKVKTTLEGQLVCSECWFEADRKTTAYGTPADIQCAADCAVKGIPPAVAVKQGEEFRLYLIEPGQFKQNSEEWLTYIGKWVQISGSISSKKEKQYVAVDEIRVLTSPQEKVQNAAVLGLDPDLRLKDLFGVEQALSAYRGKIVVLNFWATWCIPCRKEMPDLAAIQNQYAALNVQVIGASADHLAERSKVLQFIKDVQINFPVWLGATTEDMKRFGLGPGLPGTAIIGRHGKILSLKSTVITRGELQKEIDTLLASDAKSVKGEIAAARHEILEVSLVPS
jgi:thiol-disulfide isomerase/thioredoxin